MATALSERGAGPGAARETDVEAALVHFHRALEVQIPVCVPEIHEVDAKRGGPRRGRPFLKRGLDLLMWLVAP